jgi:hypothetical protein
MQTNSTLCNEHVSNIHVNEQDRETIKENHLSIDIYRAPPTLAVKLGSVDCWIIGQCFKYMCRVSHAS